MEALIYLVTECLARHGVDAPTGTARQGLEHGIPALTARSPTLSETFVGNTPGEPAAG